MPYFLCSIIILWFFRWLHKKLLLFFRKISTKIGEKQVSFLSHSLWTVCLRYPSRCPCPYSFPCSCSCAKFAMLILTYSCQNMDTDMDREMDTDMETMFMLLSMLVPCPCPWPCSCVWIFLFLFQWIPLTGRNVKLKNEEKLDKRVQMCF
jgi:hypothetical protein